MKRHLRLAPLLALFLLAPTFSNGQEKKDAKDRNYYPLNVGNEWFYKVTSGNNIVTAISTIAELETIDGVSLARLEQTVNDKIVATEHLSQTAEGVFRHRIDGKKIVPPICLIKYPVKTGDKWDGPMAIGNSKMKYAAEAKAETITVQSVKYKAMRVAIRVETKKEIVHTTYWFVADLGFVQQTLKSGKQNVLMELEKSVRGKEEKK